MEWRRSTVEGDRRGAASRATAGARGCVDSLRRARARVLARRRASASAGSASHLARLVSSSVSQAVPRPGVSHRPRTTGSSTTPVGGDGRRAAEGPQEAEHPDEEQGGDQRHRRRGLLGSGDAAGLASLSAPRSGEPEEGRDGGGRGSAAARRTGPPARGGGRRVSPQPGIPSHPALGQTGAPASKPRSAADDTPGVARSVSVERARHRHARRPGARARTASGAENARAPQPPLRRAASTPRSDPRGGTARTDRGRVSDLWVLHAGHALGVGRILVASAPRGW